MNPPVYYQGMDRDWPFMSLQLGSKVTYTCPIYLTTWDDYLTGKIYAVQSTVWFFEFPSFVFYPEMKCYRGKVFSFKTFTFVVFIS